MSFKFNPLTGKLDLVGNDKQLTANEIIQNILLMTDSTGVYPIVEIAFSENEILLVEE